MDRQREPTGESLMGKGKGIVIFVVGLLLIAAFCFWFFRGLWASPDAIPDSEVFPPP